MHRDESESDNEEVGGLFRVVSRKQHQRQETKNTCNAEDCSRFPLNLVRDWTQQDVSACFNQFNPSHLVCHFLITFCILGT